MKTRLLIFAFNVVQLHHLAWESGLEPDCSFSFLFFLFLFPSGKVNVFLPESCSSSSTGSPQAPVSPPLPLDIQAFWLLAQDVCVIIFLFQQISPQASGPLLLFFCSSYVTVFGCRLLFKTSLFIFYLLLLDTNDPSFLLPSCPMFFPSFE